MISQKHTLAFSTPAKVENNPNQTSAFHFSVQYSFAKQCKTHRQIDSQFNRSIRWNSEMWSMLRFRSRTQQKCATVLKCRRLLVTRAHLLASRRNSKHLLRCYLMSKSRSLIAKPLWNVLFCKLTHYGLQGFCLSSNVGNNGWIESRKNHAILMER